jgi:hypothetical protein
MAIVVSDVIAAVDLDVVVERVTERLGWTPEHARDAGEQYRAFLADVADRPSETVRPTHDADELWHQHIVDTRKYAADCDAIFGAFLHHVPERGTCGPALAYTCYALTPPQANGNAGTAWTCYAQPGEPARP